jgi:hypothetical protein
MFSDTQAILTSIWPNFTAAEEANSPLPPKKVRNTAADKARHWGRVDGEWNIATLIIMHVYFVEI